MLQFGALLLTSLSFFTSPTIVSTRDVCSSIAVQSIQNVDVDRVRETWLGWYNDYRASLHLAPYALDETLDRTAGNWSFYAVKRGTIDHKRSAASPYYDYPAIEAWFRQLGVTFANVDRKTFTENIGWGAFACPANDCTDELIASIRSTFDFFMSEKGKAHSPHYNAIVAPEFTKIGLGLGVDPVKKRYYLTTHFATKLMTSVPDSCDVALN